MTDALSGIRVLDFSIWMFGPISTQVLGDFGAEVVKVEPPGGEPGRGIGRGHPLAGGLVSTRYLSRNRNKKSICIDLRTDEGKAIVRKLVAGCDVVVQNFRPNVAGRLGLSYEELREINPGLVYVSGSGYGRTGPYENMGGQDRVAQAMSGFTAGNGNPGTVPLPARTSIMDVFGGMMLAQGVLLALHARQRTGTGQRVDLALLDAAIFSNIEGATTYLNTGEMVGQLYEPLMGVYQTRDSYLQLVMVFVRHGKPLSLLCEVIGLPDLSEDPRFDSSAHIAENAALLTSLLQEAFRTRTTAEWLDVLRARDIICAPVYNYAEVFADPQVKVNDVVREVSHPEVGTIRLLDQPIKLSGTPARIDAPPPTVGQHTDELLTGLGFGKADITRLRQSGVVA